MSVFSYKSQYIQLILIKINFRHDIIKHTRNVTIYVCVDTNTFQIFYTCFFKMCFFKRVLKLLVLHRSNEKVTYAYILSNYKKGVNLFIFDKRVLKMC